MSETKRPMLPMWNRTVDRSCPPPDDVCPQHPNRMRCICPRRRRVCAGWVKCAWRRHSR